MVVQMAPQWSSYSLESRSRASNMPEEALSGLSDNGRDQCQRRSPDGNIAHMVRLGNPEDIPEAPRV